MMQAGYEPAQVENLAHDVALHYMHYNFARGQKTVKTTRRRRGRRS
jgi:hypothetical protein